jgi:hypothetical protein
MPALGLNGLTEVIRFFIARSSREIASEPIIGSQGLTKFDTIVFEMAG